MARSEEDAISNAIVETEREIAGAAWGEEDTELDESGDRSLESMGEGLEGQHEPEDDEEPEAEEAEGDEESEDEVGAAEVVAEAGKGKGEQPKPQQPIEQEQPITGRVPAGKHREALERARVAEAALEASKAELARAGETKSLAEKLDLALREIDNLKRAPRSEPKPGEPPKVETAPDIFEDPKGFVAHLTGQFQSELQKRDAQLANQRVENSMAIAHAIHKDTFEKAFGALNQLNPQNPDDRVAVQRIYSSPNPGEALVAWHKRNETLTRVGNDPDKFEERIRTEAREALMKDPEFLKEIVAAARGDAARGDNGQPRTITRLPKSLNGALGSNVGADRGDPTNDGSDQAVAESAWR